jgi:hypothetical protein
MKIKQGDIVRHSMFPSLEGMVIEEKYGNAKVAFSLTKQQYYDVQKRWGVGEGAPGYMRKPGLYTRLWFLKTTNLTNKPALTKEDQKMIDELRAKKNRSPVEEYILDGLESC